LYHFALAAIKNRRKPRPGLLRARVERANWGGAAAVQGADGSGGNPLLAGGDYAREQFTNHAAYQRSRIPRCFRFRETIPRHSGFSAAQSVY
jgi:hypothetical protein